MTGYVKIVITVEPEEADRDDEIVVTVTRPRTVDGLPTEQKLRDAVREAVDRVARSLPYEGDPE